MTDARWAWERAIKIWKGFRGGLIDYGTQLLEAEHARSVRIVKAEINAVKRDRHNYSTTTRVEMVKRLEGLQAKLEHGRGGKG